MRRLLRLRSQRGQAIIEFVMVFPLMALLLFAVVDFGLALYERHVITNAVAEAVREAAYDPSSTEGNMRSEAVVFSHDTLVDPDDFDVVNHSCDVGDEIKLQVSHDYYFFTPLGGLLDLMGTDSDLGVSIPLNAKAAVQRAAPC